MDYQQRSAKPSEKLLNVLAPSGRAIGRVVVAGLVGIILAASPVSAFAEEAILASAASDAGAIVETVNTDATEEGLTEAGQADEVADQADDAAGQTEVAADDAAVAEEQQVASEDTELTETPAEEQSAVEGELAEEVSNTEPAAEETQAVEPLATVDAKVENATEAIAAQGEPKQGHWVVDARSGSLERYWVWEDGTLAKNVLITPENGAKYYAYARSDGRIVRGKWDSGHGLVYVADNEGKLLGSDLDEDGWVVTGIYDGGYQRYYVDAALKGARSGFFSVKNYGDAFGAAGQGYVVREDFIFGDRKWSADNDGKLRSGWYVTSGFGDGLQRYWMGDTVFGSPHAAAINRLIDSKKEKSGYDAYATSAGYVVRGRLDNGKGRVYIADNDGKLIGSGMTKSGWIVTDKFDGHLERYYVDAVTKAAVSGFFTVDGYGDVFGRGGTGIIHRGAMPFGAMVILADNDGKLPTKGGWLVTSIYNQGLQRYWVEKVYGKYYGTKPGYSTSGYAHYTTADGYVLRNGIQKVGSEYYQADNDGKLKKIEVGWVTINGTRYFRRVDGTMVKVTNAGYSAWKNIQGYNSKDYIIAIDNNSCRVFIFTGSLGNWMPLFDWTASVGCTPAQGGDDTFGETFRGISHVRAKGYSMGNDPWEYYWTEFFINGQAERTDGEGQRFHTELYKTGHPTGNPNDFFDPADRTLGKKNTHGCVRLATANAKWIYYNIPIGTTVWSY
ncbi:MAG: L,D-transpeptidase family protein [Atopobiaceae bacterium]|nr:L,D-transpeptidase family protein [Atopobiaceae bacterium]